MKIIQKFRYADVTTKNLSHPKPEVTVFQIISGEKNLLIIFWPFGVYDCVQEKAAVKLDKEIPDKRTRLDRVVASCAAVCLFI